MAQLQGVIKSMPDYAQHHRAGVCWPREGREFVIGDAEMFKIVGEDARKLREELARQFSDDPARPSVPQIDMPVVYHVADPTEQNPKRVVMKRGRIIDIPGKPVVMDDVAYEYVKQAFGFHLSCEPLGMTDVMALAQENVRLKSQLEKFQQAKK